MSPSWWRDAVAERTDLDMALEGSFTEERDRDARTAAFDENQARDQAGMWTSEGGGSSGGSTPRSAGDVISRAKAAEPHATATMQQIAAKTGGQLVGLDFRLKSEESLQRKIDDKIAEGMTPEQAAADVKDALRYTVAADADAYSGAHATATDELRAQGWEQVKSTNYWAPGDSYQGLNTWWRTPDGQTVELQFHTPESARVKEDVHVLYNEAREDTTPPARRAELESTMAGMWDSVPIPPGAIDLQ